MAKHESAGMSDEWYTPKYIFDALGCKFNMDVSAPVDRTHCHVPANIFITKNADGSVIEWEGFVWCNSPFGKKNSKSVWLDRMDKHRNGIALTPDRSSATWWQDAAKKCDALLQVHGKIKFIKPDGTTGDSPSTGTSLFAYGEYAVRALRNAERKGLGIFLTK